MKYRTAKEIGAYGERVASRYLLRRGYVPIKRNYRAGKYEIDLIAIRFSVIAFVEVKTRTYRDGQTEDSLPPSAAVDRDKIRFTRAAANAYLREHPTGKKPRMDVLEVWLSPAENGKKPKVLRIHHIPAAY